ncbi:MAG: signal peptidase II [Alphaproteobacteria bacterium]
MTMAGEAGQATPARPVRAGRLLLATAVLAVVVIAADQATKYWAVTTLFARDFGDPALFAGLPPRAIEVTGFFNWVLVGNTGVSFGMFQGAGTWVFILIALIIAAFMVGWLLRSGRRWLIGPVGLIIGGAVGNVIDRFRFGAVVDFIQLHAAGYYFPAFNVADSAISLAMVVVVAEALFGPKEQDGAKGAKGG